MSEESSSTHGDWKKQTETKRGKAKDEISPLRSCPHELPRHTPKCDFLISLMLSKPTKKNYII